MSRVQSFIVLAAAAALVGCGGGGGGGPKNKGFLTLSLVAAPGTASGPEGTSHRIVVSRKDGTVLLNKTFDTSPGTVTTTLSNLPTGTLLLHAVLSANGVEVGMVDTTFEGGAATPITLAMRHAANMVTVTPDTDTVAVGSTKPFYAAARDVDGAYVYEAPASWIWTSQSASVATVSASGMATGVAEGSATVRANLNGTGLSDAATLGVTANGVRRGKWTVMVFLNAANDLWSFADDNVNQMERIAGNPDVRFVVQWKQVKNVGGNSSPLFSGTRRYVAAADTGSTIRSTLVQDLGSGVDMGSPGALNEFVRWAKDSYPADHYALVVWNHGAGWNDPNRARLLPTRGISYDEQTGNHLDLPDVGDALEGTGSLDILAYDACLMQGAEDLIELSDKASYIVASEENTPGPGFPYDAVFKAAYDDASISALGLATSMPAAFTQYYSVRHGIYDYRDWALHLSALDTSKVGAFRTALDNFGITLTNAGSGLGSLMSDVRAANTRMDPVQTTYWYYDLDGIAQKTAALSTDAGVTTAANTLRGAIADLVVANSTSASGTYMKGLSIEFANSGRFANYSAFYNTLRLARLTRWDDFLTSPANP